MTQRHKDRNQIFKLLLNSLKVAGLISVAIVAPNLIGSFAKFNKVFSDKKYNNYRLRRSLTSLEDKGLVSIGQEGNKTIIKLTKNGQQKLLKFNVDDLQIKIPKKWDKKFRIVIFDIPERKKKARYAFRSKVKEMGFIQIQKSVWLYLYPCEDEIDFIKEVYEIRPYVRVITAERIDIQNDILKKFNLKNNP